MIHQVRRRLRHAPCAGRRTTGCKPRRLPLKATSVSWLQSPQRRRKKPWARMPHSRKASNSALDVLRQVGAGGGLSCAVG